MAVLITDGNERSALAATRALGWANIEVIVGAETERSLAGASKYCRHSFSYASPYFHGEAFVAQVKEAVERFKVDVLVPMSDVTTVLLGDKVRDVAGRARIAAPRADVFEEISDKWKLMELAGALGVPIPDTIFVPDGRVDAVLGRISRYPVVVKPVRSLICEEGVWRKTSVHIASTESELRQLYRELDYLWRPSMIQERVEGRGRGLFALMDHGTPVALFAHERLREKPPCGGVSVLRQSIALSEPMTDYALRLLRHVRWHGVAMVEFKWDERTETPVLMEVNGRFWGSVQLAIDAGVNFPLLLYQMATGQPMRPTANQYRIGARSRWLLGDLDQLLVRLWKSDEALHLPAGYPSRLRSLAEFCRFVQPGMRYEMLRSGDPGPFLHELRQFVADLTHNLQAKMRRRQQGRSGGGTLCGPDEGPGGSRPRRLSYGALGSDVSQELLRAPVRRVLIVCKGNICRSPLAESYMKMRLTEQNRSVEVSSAGLETSPGKAAHPLARLVAQRDGVSLNGHTTTPLKRELVAKADIVLVMEARHLEALARTYPEAAGKVVSLGRFNGNGRTEIFDPFGGTLKDFEACYGTIRECCDNFLYAFALVTSGNL